MGDRMVEIEGDTDDHTLEENEGRAAGGNRRKEDLLKEHTEGLAEIEGGTDDQTLEENEGSVAERNRTVEDLLKDNMDKADVQSDSKQGIDGMLTGLRMVLDKLGKDAGAPSEGQLRMTDLAKEQINRLLGVASGLVDQTVENTTGKTAEWKLLEDLYKGQRDLIAQFGEIDDPTVEDVKGRCAEWMIPMEDFIKEQLDLLAALKETDDPTEQNNEGISPAVMRIIEKALTGQINVAPFVNRSLEDIEDIKEPLAEVQLNVDTMKKIITESAALAERARDDLPGLPPEIRRMDKVSQKLFREAQEAGKEKVYNIRLMIVGHLGVGKTTLTKRILGEEVAEAPHMSTEGIEVHPRCVRIDLDTKEWIVEGTEHRFPDTSQLLVNIVSGHIAHQSKNPTDGVNQEEKNSIRHLVKNKEQDLKEGIQQAGIGSRSTDGAFSASFKEGSLLFKREGDTAINKTVSNSDLHDFVTKYRTMTHSEKVFCYLTVLDFAGQFVFYTTHQAFMSWRTLYLLVTDMSKSLDDVVKDDKCSMSLHRNMECSIKDYAVFWLNSIYSHGIPAKVSPQCEGRTQRETENDKQDHRGEEKYPPVILVATHSDKVPKGENKETKEEYFNGVRKILKERPQRFLLKGYFAFSNFGPNTDIDVLKQKIVELAEKQDYWGEEIPGRWLALEQKLMELKRRGIKIIDYSFVEEINNRSDVKIEKPDELEVFLRFEHDLGNIVFFCTQKLREKVVLDPEWLMDAVKILMSPPQQVREDPEIYPKVIDFLETGRLAKSLIGHLWSGDEHEDFHKSRDHLLDLMEKLSIFAKSVEQDGIVEEQKQYYWVPCVIYKSAPDHVKNPKPCEGMTRTSTLCFESKTKFIHVGVFHRLVASLLSKWTPSQQKEGGEYKLYYGCCEFEVDQCHNLLLAQNDYVILATMFRYSSGGEYPDKGLCSDVRKLISSTLAEITACICPNSKFEICVKCEKSSTDTINGLHRIIETAEKRCTCNIPNHPVNVETLLKFWEVDPEQSEMVSEDSESNKQGELHRTVLNRCLPGLVKGLDFKAVFPFIQQKELFDDVTMRDISEQKTTSDKIEELIKRVKQGGHKTYEMFKECLVHANQASLKAQLEDQEEEIAKATKGESEAM